MSICILDTHALFDIGRMDVICRFCGAKRFRGEPVGICCKSGNVNDVPKIPSPPAEWQHLFSGDTSQSKQFLSNARKYNNCFSLTSIETNWKIEGNYMPTVKIEGMLYHRIGSLLPDQGEEPKFLQIYFVGKYFGNKAKGFIAFQS